VLRALCYVINKFFNIIFMLGKLLMSLQVESTKTP